MSENEKINIMLCMAITFFWSVTLYKITTDYRKNIESKYNFRINDKVYNCELIKELKVNDE